ncbi:hypothetical protein Tco_0988314 [Tanacetum coccineum]|uniref:Uncharacterized protein n=1 Tax=Tanacetum coccineum TaxID=301880 RepID=A0ABQ5EQN7_9ASTR
MDDMLYSCLIEYLKHSTMITRCCVGTETISFHFNNNRLIPSCFMIFDLEPLSLSFNFVFASEIFKSLSFRFDRLCQLAILSLEQHAHTLHHLERFPAQSIGSSNTDVIDLLCLLVLITGTFQSRQHVDTSLIHIESRKSPTAVLFDDDTGRISIRHVLILIVREVSYCCPELILLTPEELVGPPPPPSPASEDSHVEVQEIVLGNIPQSYEVPTTPHIRIHKYHPIEHVIGDVQSSVQTRRMKTSYPKKDFLVLYMKVGILVDITLYESEEQLWKAIYVSAASNPELGMTLWQIISCAMKELCDGVEKAMEGLSFNMSSMENSLFFSGDYMSIRKRKANFYQMENADDVDEHLYLRSMIGSFDVPYNIQARYKVCSVCDCVPRILPLDICGVTLTVTHAGATKDRDVNYIEGMRRRESITATIDGHSMTITDGSLRRTFLLVMNQDWIGALEDDLKKTKTTYSSAYTKIILRVKKLESQIKSGKARRKARVVLSDDEVLKDDSSKQGRKYADTAGRTVTYRRRSEEKRTRKDKGKAIMTEPEPKKKSKKELEQERLSFAEAIRLQEQMDEEQRAQIARDEEIARQWDEEEGQRAMSRSQVNR